MDYWLALLATVLTMGVDKPGRDRLAWLAVESVLGPLCAAVTLLATLALPTRRTQAGPRPNVT